MGTPNPATQARARAIRERRWADGVCIVCEDRVSGGTVYCVYHRRQANKTSRDRKRRAHGFTGRTKRCSRCRRRGHNIRTCPKHALSGPHATNKHAFRAPQ